VAGRTDALRAALGVAAGQAAQAASAPSRGDRLRTSILDGPDALTRAEADWDRLVEAGETGSVFQTHAWQQSWWSALGEGWEPRSVVVWRDSAPVGVAPFAVDRQSPDVIRFAGAGRADYCDLLGAADDKPAIVEAVFETLERSVPWQVVELTNVPATSATVDALARLCREAGFRFVVDDQFTCPTLVIRGREESARRIHGKPSLRRPCNALERSGQVACRTITEGLEIARLLEPFFAQHVSRWSRSRTPSLFNDARHRHFYRELAARLSVRGWLHFSLVELNRSPIAFHFGFDHADTLTWYKPSFDVAHADRSPGMVLLRHLIGESIDRQRRELDFTVGDEAFKRRFANGSRRTVRLRVFRHPSSFVLERSRRAMIAVAKRFTRRPSLSTLMRSLRT
jgi:CelD/BcsL family acetyltransferase involved in cellulose biosynthesis